MPVGGAVGFGMGLSIDIKCVRCERLLYTLDITIEKGCSPTRSVYVRRDTAKVRVNHLWRKETDFHVAAGFGYSLIRFCG